MTKKAKIFSKLKRRFLKNIWAARLTVAALVLTGAALVIFLFGLALKNTTLAQYWLFAKTFIFVPEGRIESFEGWTNIAVLGKGGGGHDAPDLTDTIIFASISNEQPSVTLVSLPRDIWMADLRAKLNSAYYWGNQKKAGGGIILAKSSIEEVVCNPVHYGVVINFDGFLKIIDALGGIEVAVERSFVDERFPVAGRENDECGGDPEFACRYETIEFKEGLQIMTGETALKFVRSRNSQDEVEGTDLARAARQQKVLAAIKKAALVPKLLLRPRKVLRVWTAAKASVETDLDTRAMAVVARRLLEARDNLNSYVVPEEFLVVPPKSLKYDNLYVFIPRAEDFSEIHTWVKTILD